MNQALLNFLCGRSHATRIDDAVSDIAELLWVVLPPCRVCRRKDPLSGEAQIADSDRGHAYPLSTRLPVSRKTPG